MRWGMGVPGAGQYEPVDRDSVSKSVVFGEGLFDKPKNTTVTVKNFCFLYEERIFS
jgi:hypothetical protein